MTGWLGMGHNKVHRYSNSYHTGECEPKVIHSFIHSFIYSFIRDDHRNFCPKIDLAAPLFHEVLDSNSSYICTCCPKAIHTLVYQHVHQSPSLSTFHTLQSARWSYIYKLCLLRGGQQLHWLHRRHIHGDAQAGG